MRALKNYATEYLGSMQWQQPLALKNGVAESITQLFFQQA